jgi:hypothetical protein
MAASPPRFSDFETTDVFRGPAAAPIIRTAFDRRFQSQIRRQAIPPPNFAGHFKIAEWGCGSSCVSIAAVDLKTGRVYEPPFSILGYGSPYQYEGGDAELENHVSSRLLIARGCPEDKNCGTYYYEWKGNHFEQIRFTPHGPLLP